jgi:FkbM family methyltransferase
MPTNSTPLDQVEWVGSQVIKVEDTPQPNGTWLYKLLLPSFLAKWDVFAVWEKERFASMQQHLKKGDVLLDIGTEVGWCNIIYAQMVGPENMVLMEPTKVFWPNIKATWEKNFPDIDPLACYNGLISNKTTDKTVLPKNTFPDIDGELIHSMSYTYIHEHGQTNPQIALDDYVKATKIIPNAITIDTEGSCVLIIKGAMKTLAKYHPMIWISVHPDLMARDYNTSPEELHDLMDSLGYKREFLAEDHEQHFRYYHE